MKERLLDLLVCPDCGQGFALKIREQQKEEILEGSLHCGSGHQFLITKGVPRFTKAASYADSFGFQWNKFAQVQLDSFNGTNESEQTWFEKTGFSRDALSGKLFLDAGVGAGRFSDVVSRYAAEVVGVDLTSAVDAAYQNIGSRPNVHLIQTDLFRLPLREKSFDFIFSIGVLHHTPDTRKAFEALIPHLKNNGEIAIWVYDRYSPFRKITDPVRKITSRIPARVVLFFSTVAIPAYYLKPLRTVFQGVFRLSMHRNWKWRWLDTFDYFTPVFQWKHTYPEVFSWFEEAGLTEIKILSAPVSMKARRRINEGEQSD